MFKLSIKSITTLSHCDDRIIKLMNEVIKRIDFTVISGHRTPSEQFALFEKGRQFIDGNWIVVDRKKVVTNRDGTHNKSKHNELPSMAIDIAPYPIDWQDLTRFIELSKVVKEEAEKLGIRITWGGDWKTFKDYPHYQIG